MISLKCLHCFLHQHGLLVIIRSIFSIWLVTHVSLVLYIRVSSALLQKYTAINKIIYTCIARKHMSTYQNKCFTRQNRYPFLKQEKKIENKEYMYKSNVSIFCTSTYQNKKLPFVKSTALLNLKSTYILIYVWHLLYIHCSVL